MMLPESKRLANAVMRHRQVGESLERAVDEGILDGLQARCPPGVTLQCVPYGDRQGFLVGAGTRTYWLEPDLATVEAELEVVLNGGSPKIWEDAADSSAKSITSAEMRELHREAVGRGDQDTIAMLDRLVETEDEIEHAAAVGECRLMLREIDERDFGPGVGATAEAEHYYVARLMPRTRPKLRRGNEDRWDYTEQWCVMQVGGLDHRLIHHWCESEAQARQLSKSLTEEAAACRKMDWAECDGAY